MMRMTLTIKGGWLRPLLLGGVLLFAAVTDAFSQEKRSIILDADTGNEVDDAYAIAWALMHPSLEVTALNATQWQASHWAVAESMEESYRLNQMMLGYLETGDKVRSLRGGVHRMFDWGDKAQHSAATHHLINEANRLPAGNKLSVIVLGALTNVASAILIDPGIASKLDVYWLGSSYDFEKGVMKKIDFNAVMDIQAVDIMLNAEVEMHIMPVSTAQALKFGFEETLKRLGTTHPLSEFLLDRWKYHMDGGRQHRVLWDLAIVAVFLNPDFGEEEMVQTSKENGNRKIGFYKSIDAAAIKEDFFKTYESFLDR